jgi:2-keto-4-pentenoate hydratase/2-oxohepta-3-ene-1,7-dioic acid hydratase in catechol pathway
MRYARFAVPGAPASWGAIEDGQLIDVPELARLSHRAAPASIQAMMSEVGTGWVIDLLRTSTAQRRAQSSRELTAVTLLAPLPDAGKIIGIGRNYGDHASEASLKLPEWPKLFPKFPSTVIGPGDSIIRPTLTSQLDFEVELAVVIGRVADKVSEEDALAHVAGYTIVNDVSARDLQFADEQLTLGKNFSTFCPMGPLIVDQSELPDPEAIEVRLRLNGVTMQDSTTAELIFSIPYLVAFCSYVMTLHPGDVIATGTPSGVGCFRDPPVWLQPGDVVESEVSGIGTLVNTVESGTGQAPRRRSGAGQLNLSEPALRNGLA